MFYGIESFRDALRFAAQALFPAIALALPAMTALADEERHDVSAFTAPAENLRSLPGDSQEAARGKAALRLIKAYNTAIALAGKCAGRADGLDEALYSYRVRNNTTLARAVKAAQAMSALTDASKAQIRKEVAAASVDCQSLAGVLKAGRYDLYKFDQAADYQLLKDVLGGYD